MLKAVISGWTRSGLQTLTVALRLTSSEQFRSMSSCPGAHRVPVTLLGSMAFGGRADADTSAQMVNVFLERGHDELDTAFMYTDGHAEAIIGAMQLPHTGGTGSARITSP